MTGQVAKHYPENQRYSMKMIYIYSNLYKLLE